MRTSTAKFMARRLGLAVLGALICCACVGGESALPTPTEQAGVMSYRGALQHCKDDAKARDADLSDYEACAAGVDRQYGRADAGR